MDARVSGPKAEPRMSNEPVKTLCSSQFCDEASRYTGLLSDPSEFPLGISQKDSLKKMSRAYQNPLVDSPHGWGTIDGWK